MKVLLLSQYCYPEPDLKCLPLAIELRSKGFEVEVLTAYPSHPLGKIYEGYKMRLLYTETIDGIRINRVPLFIDRSNSALKRVANYVSFALAACVVGVWRTNRADVIYVYHGPATIAIPAIWMKLIWGSRILYDINDYWPDSISATGMIRNKWIIAVVGVFCRVSYYFFDRINVVSKGYRDKLLEIGVPESRISLIYNWPLAIGCEKSESFQPYEKMLKSKFSVVYAGNIGKAQSLEVLIKAAAALDRMGITDVVFLLVGEGVESEQLKRSLEREGVSKTVRLVGAVPPNNVGEFLEAADVLFLHLRRDPLFEITIPSKLGNYLSIGKPVLCGVAGEAAEMVRTAGAGLCFEPDDHVDLNAKLLTLKALKKPELCEMGKKGRECFEAQISFEEGSKKMISILESLATRSCAKEDGGSNSLVT